jgi:ATP-binding cassette subfamily B protein
LPELELPAIIHWELNHFLVLERVHGGGADLVDPAIGRRHVSSEELGRAFTGIVLELMPGDEFEKRKRPRRSAQAYKGLLARLAWPITVMIASAFLLEIFALLFPAATSLVVDFVVRPRQESWIAILAVAFGGAVALRAAIAIARDRILGGLEARLDLELAATLVKHLLALPTAFFANRGTGDLLSRVGGLLGTREMFGRVFLAGFDVLLVIAYAALMLLYDPRLGGLIVGLQLLMVLVTTLGRGRVRTALTARLLAAGRAHSTLVQAFADPETAKAFRAETLLASRYGAARSGELNARAEGERALELSKHSLAVFEAVGAALVLWVGGRAVLDDRMTLGVLASFLAIQTLLTAPLLRIVAALRDLAGLGPRLDRVDDILNAAPEPGGTYIPDDIEGAVTFENVSFRYGRSGPLLLDGVSFHMDAGERVAIAGASGAGKSTILRLVLGFIQPTSGRIWLDGRDLREYDLNALRSSIGTVLASGAFFDETVFDNVTLGAPGATATQVRVALEAACVSEVVDGLPRGALTRLGAGASRLSGGQRQRLLLTRALVKSPTMLLLDEASSALDAELELRVQAYLARMRCTMIVIAHRLSAVTFADRVLFLEKGKIVQDGPFALLARQPGPVQNLVRASEGIR